MDIITQFAAGEHINTVDSGADLQKDVSGILSAIIAVLGFACVAVMIVGGVQYMTSSGDTAKVEKAKKTILYGMIGLIVSALAFAIVQFVVNTILASPAQGNASDYSTQIDCERAGYSWKSGACK